MYKVTKMGLLNFWYYDEEEYEFFDGKILLRGRNGSGKSVTMQSFIPLILDGNKTPKRLDTFGGTDKHIEYYLLDETKDDSTGYLYMEFFDKDLNKYITIGIGLHAKKGKPTEFYGFALQDGSRINHDFYLYKLKDGLNKTPLTKIELKTRLIPNNIFVETAKDYKKMVNKLLYGFKNIESYDELINIILQIRSPKLSKEYKPSILMHSLNDVLPPLSDEDLTPLSDTIESLNSTKETIDDLKNKIRLLTNFIKIYNNYNETILYNKAKNYLAKKSNHEILKKTAKESTKTISELQEKREKLTEEQTTLTKEYQRATIEKDNLGNNDLEAKTKRQVTIEKEIAEYQTEITKSRESIDNLNTKINNLKKDNQNYENSIYSKEKDIKRLLKDLEDLSSEIHFSELGNFLPILLDDKLEDLNQILEIINKKEKEIEQIKYILEEQSILERKINEESSKYDQEKNAYNDLISELENLEEELAQDKIEFINALTSLSKTNQELTLKEYDLKELFTIISDYTIETHNLAKEKYLNYYQDIYQHKIEELSRLEVTLEQTSEELKIEEQKLENLKNDKEASLDENTLETNIIEFLTKEKIKYIPLYKAIDFQDNIKSEIKNTLEANLLSSGLLNAKIISPSDIKKVSHENITYLTPSTKKKENLTKYLKPADISEFDKKYITSILESISIDKSDTIYINEVSYQFDFLKSNNSLYESKYIGYLARIEEHKRLIAKQEKIITELRTKQKSLSNLISNLKSKLEILNSEKNLFPSNANILRITNEINSNELKKDIILKEQERIENTLRELNNELTTLLERLNQIKGNNKIPLNLASFKEAVVTIKEIKNYFYNLNSTIKEKSNLEELLMVNNSHMESTSETITEHYSNISLIENKCHNLKLEKETIEKILNTKEYKELSTKLKQIEEILSSFNSKNTKLSKNLGIVESDLKYEEEHLQEIELSLKKSSKILEIYYAILGEEHNLGYIMPEFELTENNIDTLIKELKNSENRDKTTATSNFYKGLNDYRGSLLDYSLNDITLFSDRENSIKIEENNLLDETELIEIYNEATRQDITATYQNKKVNLYSLLEMLKDDYETSRYYLSEKDRHLFEDILLKTIGGKIKDKINSSTAWVKKINSIMEEKQKNSNLSFYLSWNMKSKESLEEMDTKELVEIFKMDPEMVKPTDTEKLIKHFRAKISRAEETMVDNKESYFDIVFKILDYRNWFEFKMYYKKGDKDKRELSDKIFSVFSGGEKAKSMYIPLFACALAKLSNANPNAPHLIALDEAFAGVDDDNIEEMFGILKSFNIDYILTSQSLWCDYSEVSDISICELINDHRTKVIGIKRYRWNGKTRTEING